MAREFSVKCTFCKRMTLDESGRCADHRNISASAIRKHTFGNVSAPPKADTSFGSAISNSYDDVMYLKASEVRAEVANGVSFELDITDGYGDIFDEISSIEDGTRPNEGLLAITTKNGTTIYFAPEEHLDVKIRDSDTALAS